MKVPFIDLKRAHDPIKSELLEAFSSTIDHGGFCLGKDVEQFELEFAKVQGVSRCVGLGSGTEALHLIACAMGIGRGDEVIVPAFTFIASAWFAQYVGARPVFWISIPIRIHWIQIVLRLLLRTKLGRLL